MITSLTSRNMYAGAGSTGPYAFNFRIFSTSDLRVTKRSSAGVETTLAYGTDWTLTTGVNVGDATGSITLTAALASGEVLAIRRAPALTQPTSIQNQGSYFPKTHEDEFDRLVMQVQSLEDTLGRALAVTESFDPATLALGLTPVTGQVLGWLSATQLGNLTLNATAIGVPGGARTVATATAYLLNNAVFNVKDYGAVGDGVTNDTAAIAKAVSDAQTAAGVGVSAQDVGSGACVYFPHGRYLTDEITVTQNGVAMIGEGKGVCLLARAANQTIVRLAASYCNVHRLSLKANGFLGVRGLGIVPADETQNTTVVYQNFNHIQDVFITECLTGVELRCGPSPGGDSQCYYNSLMQVHALNCQVGFKINTASGGGNSGANRNQFYSCRVGVNAGGPVGYGNVGFYVLQGDTSSYVGCSTEGIALGTSPLTNPTGLYIAATGTNNTRHYGYTAEGNTRDIECNNFRTLFFGPDCAATKCFGTSPFGGVCLPADPSNMPLNIPGLGYGEGISGVASGRWGVSKPLDVTGDITTTLGISTASGVSAAVANAATFDITVTPRRPQILVVWASYDLNKKHMWMVQGDGAGNVSLTAITTAGGVTVAGTGPTTVTVTNAYGAGTADIHWSILALGAAVA